MASLTGFTLPEIKDSDLNDEKQRRQILEYLYQLTEQLRFTLSNLDEENFSDSVSDNIKGAYTAAFSASKEVKDMSGNVSRIKQFADTLTLAVENGDTSSSIALMANGVQIASEEIILRGAVTFTDLETAGRTIINGFNIKTGKVSANVIDVDNLKVKHLEGADGTFTGILSAVTGEIGGFTINADGSLIGDGLIVIPSGRGSGTGIILPGTNTNGGIRVGGKNGIALLGSSAQLDIHGNTRIHGALQCDDGFAVTGLGDGEVSILDVNFDYFSGYSNVVVYSSGGNLGTSTYPWGQCVAQKLYSSSGGVSSYSMRSLKKDIKAFTLPEGAFDKLTPVYFVMRDDKKQRRHVGFIADDVKEICPEVVDEFEGILTLDYSKITTILVDEVKKLRKRVARLEA